MGTEFLNIIKVNFALQKTMIWLWRLFAGLSARRPVIDPMSVRVRFMVDEVAMGQYFYEYFRFPLSVTFSVLISIHMMLLPDGQTGEDWELTNKQCCFGNRREFDRNIFTWIYMWLYFLFYSYLLFTLRPLLLGIT